MDGTPNSEWIKAFYGRVTSEFALARNSLHATHNWATTLATGAVIASIGVAGKGAFPTENAVMALAVSIPLLFRFFVRSCLECSIQHRWIQIRNALDWYLSTQGWSEEARKPYLVYLRQSVSTYYYRFRSPKRVSEVVKENLNLIYFWPFALLGGMLAWGVVDLLLASARHRGLWPAAAWAFQKPVGWVLVASILFTVVEAFRIPRISVLKHELVGCPDPPAI